MFHFITPLKTALAALFLSISLFFSGGAPLGSAIQPVADFRSSLTSGITAVATSMTLVSTSTASGEYLTSGKVYGFKLGGREYVVGTLSAGKQITSMTRGISLITGTTTGGVAEAWGRGTAVEVTDAPILLQISNKINGTEYFDNSLTYAQSNTTASSSNQIPGASWVYNNFVNTSETQSVTGAKTFAGATSTFSNGILDSAAYRCATGSNVLTLCDKFYVDSVAVAGASNADTVTKGIVEIATQAEVNAGTAIGGTGASLVVTPVTLFQLGSTTASYSTSTDLMTGTSSISLSSNSAVRELTVHFVVGSTTPETTWRLNLNGFMVTNFLGETLHAGILTGVVSNLPQVSIAGLAGNGMSIDMTISSSTKYKIINFNALGFGNSAGSGLDFFSGSFYYATTVPITSISLSPASATASLASTILTVFTR